MNRSRFLVSAEDETQVDITPMLDVVFIMLIFIVTSTFVKESGVDVTPRRRDCCKNGRADDSDRYHRKQPDMV